ILVDIDSAKRRPDAHLFGVATGVGDVDSHPALKESNAGPDRGKRKKDQQAYRQQNDRQYVAGPARWRGRSRWMRWLWNPGHKASSHERAKTAKTLQIRGEIANKLLDFDAVAVGKADTGDSHEIDLCPARVRLDLNVLAFLVAFSDLEGHPTVIRLGGELR